MRTKVLIRGRVEGGRWLRVKKVDGGGVGWVLVVVLDVVVDGGGESSGLEELKVVAICEMRVNGTCETVFAGRDGRRGPALKV